MVDGTGRGRGGVLVAHGLTDVCGMDEAGARSRHASRIAFDPTARVVVDGKSLLGEKHE